MRRLSSLILLLLLSISLAAQKSPHGAGFKANCDDCHKTDGWKVDLKTVSFNHDATKFPLVGQHRDVSCRDCHTTLAFAQAKTDCFACHTDIHEQTVGNECARCHTPNSWVVSNITQLHQASRFPLIGPHAVAACEACHKNLYPSSTVAGTASRLRFNPMGIECYDCHKENYLATTSPSHVKGNYSKNCTECHKLNSFSWTDAGINHSFFPLEGGHAINDCFRCHTSGTFVKISSDCYSCHQPDYTATTNPNHKTLSFPTSCKDCHTLNPGWKPAEYREHDAASFPIYSGTHKGVWNSCADCHTNPANYAQFTCINCHEHSNKTEVDNNHQGVSGYNYNSSSCYACHPAGSSAGSFDHNKSSFPLTGAHTTTACADCHTNGYAGTPNTCASCHTKNYNQTTNPNHGAINIPNDCATCHTTAPGWKPANFAIHNTYYRIEGAHLAIANDCATCHNGDYTHTPNTCFGCHSKDYNQANNPNHLTAQFPTTCATCHSQTAWVPSIFDHNTVFPLTGAHTSVACSQCHVNGYVNTPSSCAGCHQSNYNQSANPNHKAIGINTECATCHTTNPGWEPALFPIHNSYYVLAGAHTSRSCTDCHKGNYVSTPNTCAGCHTDNYNQTKNPNHTAAQFPKTCADCHSQSTWSPANWNHDAQYFPIYSGKHQGKWNTCSECHTNALNFADFSCTTSCHPQSTTNNNHQGVTGYTYNSSACLTCHPRGSAGN